MFEVSNVAAFSVAHGVADDSLADLGNPRTVAPTPPQAEIALRLIATSDLHACLMPYDYCANRATDGHGLGQIARQIAAARAEAPNSLLFDNGDFLQGNPLADYVADSPRRRRPHPVITAFNTLGYDAATLGNHEFNYGLPFLTSALAAARFPVVSANITTRLGKSPARDTTFVPPYTILTRRVVDSAGHPHRLRIGVIGFAPPQIEVWDRDHLAGRIRMRDILAAARAWLPRLKAQGADVIVALAHSGIGPAEPEEGMENAATALAALPEIDAVIAGHCHLAFPGPGIPEAPGVDPRLGRLAGKPAVMPGHSGSHVGIIDLTLARSHQGLGRWTVRSHSTRLGTPTPEPALASRLLHRAIAPDHRAALAWSRRVVGETPVPLHTHFATIAPSAAISLIAAAKEAHARAALRGTEWEHLPLLASAAPFRSGGRGGASNFTDISAGPLRMRNLSDLYVFPNTLVALALTGANLADWLEKSAALFHQITPGSQDAVLHDVAVPSVTFEVIPGLDYAIDLSQPARFDADGRLLDPNAGRIVGLSHQGQPVDPAARYVLVTNNHRASRAAAEAAGPPPKVVLANGSRSHGVLRDFLGRGSHAETAPRRNWHFLPMPGTTVTVSTGPAAEAHLADIACYRPRFIGQTAAGFAHYRLHL
ncbi:bifunctional 2',3'-cyclic-nucleotide 2'-phosphodiesterase/3'-nucleotidase [Tabrizicola sp.]|uniref:bifunctional 2',3'-cyclic-nucleotide 2'-phosphodiesterase/3'-nucleotidase n=1 Tax=Tabrizicola sp. TaxID=2005166 RepID=UPI003F39439E